MSEGSKTVSFICAALLMLTVAWLAQPRPPVADPESPAGKILNQVDDPLKATRLDIVEYAEDKAALKDFQVAYTGGRWVVPSHQNYPADAAQQMGDAATSVMNRKILGVVSTHAGDHEKYGVIEPSPNLSAGAVGVGTKVTMRDAKNDTLCNLVIGKPVKDQEGQRYVREVGKDPVYIVELDPSHLSTDFGRWIEKDLLKLNPADVVGLQLKDYSVELTLDGGRPQILMDPRSEIDLKCNAESAADPWTVAAIKEFSGAAKKLETVEPPKDEKLNQTKLNDLKSALDDLKIVDVERKPTGLSEELKADAQFAKDMEAVQSLATRGFYPLQASKDNVEIFSSEGEVNCQMKDGVVYVLRFGKITLGEGEAKPAEGDGPQEKGTGIHRYLFVSARFDENAIPKPELEALPEAPAEEKAAEEQPAEEKPAAEGEAKSEAEAQPADAEAKPAEDAVSDEAKKLAAEKLEAERKAIEKENAQKLADYEKQLEAGRAHAKELNARFGDWYYVISDEVYKKIHLGRKDIFEKVETPKGEGAGLGDLDALQKQGLGE